MIPSTLNKTLKFPTRRRYPPVPCNFFISPSNGSLEMAVINLFCEGTSWRFKNLIAFLEYEI